MIKTSQRLLALFMVIAMVAAACGRSDDESSDAVDTATTDTTAEENQETADEGDDEPTDEPVELTATDSGVTESVIRLGAVFPDLSVISRDAGDLEAKWQTIADAINDAGGINGRTIELHWRSPSPIADTDSDRVCTELTEDVEVFAAIGLFRGATGDCYGALHDTIVVNTFAIGPDEMAGYTAPGVTLIAHPERLVEPRIDALIEAGVLAEGMKIAVLGADPAQEGHDLYVAALEAAGIDIVADTVLLADGTDLLEVTAEMEIFAEVWRSRDAEAVLASTALLSQPLLIGYNRTALELPMLLPEGTGVPPSLLQDQQGLDLAPFEFAVALGDDDQATMYEKGTNGVRECVDAFEAASGEDVALDESRDNLAPTIVACQSFDMFVAIATAAGPDLTTESFAAAAEALGPIEITAVSEASSGPDKFDLSDSVGVITRFNPEAVQFQPVG